MQSKTILLFGAMMILCSGCGGNIAGITATPDFFTATLPPTFTPVPQATPSPTLPALLPSLAEETQLPPVEGTTTTQLNVRATPSTASASLGLIGIFVKVQVTGRDASGSWYQIFYTDSETGTGWVRSEYVQVDDRDEIQLVEVASNSEAAISGMVTQKVNVRNGPGTEYELLGVLNSNDIVFITGRDPDGKWIQVEFAGAPDGKGWVAAEFLQMGNIESVPLIGAEIEDAPTSTVETPTPGTISMTALLDGDSMQSPLAVAVFSVTGSRALQVSGEVSAPNGDAEDWVQFKSNGSVVAIEITCTGDAMSAELWNDGKTVNSLSCGGQVTVSATAGNDYFLRLIQGEAGYTGYVLNLEVIP